MRQPYGNSICVSTQAGCNMGCAFCASTLHGMARNLTTGEILSQAIVISDMLRAEEQDEKVDTVVIMGSGEPLMNYENVLGFIRLLHEDYVLGLSYRSITLSTSGIVPQMYKLAEEGIPISLSVSLHAPAQELRSTLMPINRKYPLADVVRAARHYAEVTKRRVTYEYILIDRVNDGEEQARELVSLLRGQLASVNLIPINPVAERHLLRASTGSSATSRRITSMSPCGARWGQTSRRPAGSCATSTWRDDRFPINSQLFQQISGIMYG